MAASTGRATIRLPLKGVSAICSRSFCNRSRSDGVSSREMRRACRSFIIFTYRGSGTSKAVTGKTVISSSSSKTATI